jgi:glucose/arabinose dehydrogenase
VSARGVAAVFLAAGLVAVACSDDTDPFAPGGEPPATTQSPPGPATTSTTVAPDGPTTTVVASPAPLVDVQIRLETVATADSPTAMATRAGTTDLYVAEKEGRVRVLEPSSGTLSDPILDISDDVSATGERGLLGLAFSPDGARLYVSYTNDDGDTRLDEYVMDGARPDGDTRRRILAVDQPYPNHNGGAVLFGPDGMLWFGLGDGGSGGDPDDNAQDVDTLLGSILRIDVRGRDEGEYSIPPDNPFASGGGRPEIWLYGLRNPWRFTFDRATGDLWIGDVGQNEVEEVDVLRAPDPGRGANLQWPLREGFRRFRGESPAGSIGPIHDYGRSDGSCSVVGGYVYRGSEIPALQGVYVFGDYCEGTMRGLFTAGGDIESHGLGAQKGSLSSFGEDASGELYVLSLDGTISRIVAA